MKMRKYAYVLAALMAVSFMGASAGAAPPRKDSAKTSAVLPSRLFKGEGAGSEISQKITGADKPIPLGELVDLSVTPLSDAAAAHLERSSYVWKVYDLEDGIWTTKRVRSFGDGVFFGAGIKVKKLKVFCVATHLFIEKEGDKIKSVSTKTLVLEADVQIGEGEPEPGPGPKPPEPTPPPPLPDGTYKLALWAYENTSLVKDADARKSGSKALAGSFGSISSAIVAGGVKTPEEALKKALEANDQALGNAKVDKAKWGDFGRALQEKLYSLYKGGNLKTVRDYAVAFSEIKAGLEAVK